MPSASNSRLQTFFSVLLSLVIASGLWYIVVGRDHVETQVQLRVEYRGLPDGLVSHVGMVNNLSVRLRGSAELLRTLHSRDLVYTVDLSGVQKGANALPLNVADLPDFKAFEILEVTPSRLVLEVDALTERVVPLMNRIIPLPVSSPYLLSHVILEPSFVTVKGPESRVNALDRLSVSYDPSKNASEGPHEASVAISAPPQVEITPPVTTLRYTLELKTEDVVLKRTVGIDGGKNSFALSPASCRLTVSIPEDLVKDSDYLDAIRVIVRPSADMAPGSSAEVPPLVMLPSGARLGSIEPALIKVTRKKAEEPVWEPAESSFSMPVSVFGMELSRQRITSDFSLDGLDLPEATLPQADDLKVQPVIPSEAGAEKADAVRAAAQQKIIRPESLPKPELNSNFSPMQAPAGKK